MDRSSQMEHCDYKTGPLPGCSPLALAVTPVQESSEPTYENKVALSRGTLFPGLDLPFMNVVNKPDHLSTPLCELMALDFVKQELKLYLDTHKNDKEAFAALQTVIRLSREGHRRYAEKYGPVTVYDMRFADRFTWTDALWPWQMCGKED